MKGLQLEWSCFPTLKTPCQIELVLKFFLTNFYNSTSRKSFQIFNLILTILPEMNNNYVVKLITFYCGLHLLIGIADVCEAALKKFETEYLDGKVVGSAQRPELQRYHKAESGTLRLLRTSSKAFAMGEDERNGIFLPLKLTLTLKEKRKIIYKGSNITGST